MKQTTLLKKTILFFSIACGAILFTSCKKDAVVSSQNSQEFGNAPRKEVPDLFVGQFTYVTTSGGYADQYGHYTDGVSQGVTYNISKDGTGTYLYLSKTGSYSGAVTTDEIKGNCTFEITQGSGNKANIIIHYVTGKNYHNGVLLHDLDASHLYPNGDVVYNNTPYGANSQGKTIFTVGTGNNTAQFTKQ